MLYFAYGSNMNWEQMHSRCPSAQFFTISSLPDYQIVFPRYSKKRRCDVASIRPAKGVAVWGVVYRIDDGDRSALDTCEGYCQGRATELNSYEPQDITVLRDGRAAQPLDVFTYVARTQDSFVPCGPNAEYRDLIISGARFWGLPPYYLEKLESISTTTHPDR